MLVLGFFFLIAAIVVGVLLAGGLLARMWWVSRRIRKTAEAGVVTTEYRVIEREPVGGPLLTGETGTRRQPEAER